MASKGLSASNSLNGFSKSFGSTTFRIVPSFELLAIAIPSWPRQETNSKLGMLPNPGQSGALDSSQHILWMGVSQYYIFDEESFTGEATMNARLDGTGYVTDISDGWVAMVLEGPDALARIDLITLPDLAENLFNVGAVTSTILAHTRVVVWRQASEKIVLLAAASSARSFINSLAHELSMLDTVSERMR